ncbi:MAG: GNAT family N-acetyltransferase [Candidatus Merdivicinus sp.]|jgi:tRNA nucleotidyltransferase (CCA-adding enzyme)
MEIQYPNFIRKALSQLNTAGYAAYVVGGCVRDSLLGRTVHDWDITTAATPEEMRKVFSGCKILSTGEQHGTLTVMIDKIPLEVTTFRTEQGYTDGRHPDTVGYARKIEEDLSRRDFTVNAMAAHPDLEVLDLFGGRKDLEKRQIRCVGDPDLRFSEDALRILRALRFASVLDFSIEPQTAAAIHRNCRNLQNISAERITSELTKLLCGKAVVRILQEYADIISFLIPELTPCIGHLQYTCYHLYDVYQHIVHSVGAIRPNPELRLTMLLHDIGKPNRFFRDSAGIGHFKGHPAESARLADGILQRMRISKEQSRRILTLIRYHDSEFGQENVAYWLGTLGPERFWDLMEVKRADQAAKNPNISNPMNQMDALEEEARKILKHNPCLSLKDLAVTGEDCMALGLKGKKIGLVLQELLYQVWRGTYPNQREILLAAIPHLYLPSVFNLSAKASPLLRPASEEDLSAVTELYEAVTEHLARIPDNLCRGWRTGEYPTQKTAKTALQNGTLYVWTAEDRIIGTVILNQDQPVAYSGGKWQNKTNNPYVIHTFALHPACRGHGMAHQFLTACEDQVRQLEGDGIRMDTLACNQPAVRLYETSGYQYAGTVDLGLEISGAKWFRLYEKQL